MVTEASFGSWLKRTRKEQDFTREELASQINCSPIMIYKIESGERRPSKQIASLLAHTFKIPDPEIEPFIKFARQTPPSTIQHEHSVKGLPSLPAPLIGRDEELATLEALLLTDKKSLVTLVGAPGVGKTSLAIQTLLDVVDRFDDDSYFVSLVSIRDVEAVASSIATSLGLTEMAGENPLNQLKSFFANRMSLLVLDNFEHLLKSKALVAELCAACPRLQILVTSRAALKLPNEAVVKVSTLKVPGLKQPLKPAQLLEYPSVGLFVQYAQASQASFAITHENAAAVAEICNRLEGIPLAIVLAAGRIKMFSPEVLLTHLDKRLGSMTTSHSPSRPNHQALRDALQWSYDLLSPGEQQLFSRLAILVNGGTFEAIESICQQPGVDTLSTLEALIDKNLVQETQDSAGQTRFSMLETLREYALEKLVALGDAQVEGLKRAHAHYFLSLAEKAEPLLRTATQLIWMARLNADQDNFEAALEWSLKADSEINLRLAGLLGWFWYIRGRAKRGAYWLRLAVANSKDAPPRFRAMAFFYISAIASVIGDYQWGFEASEEAVRLYRTLNDDRMVGQALVGHITSNLGLGRFDELNALLAEGTELARRANDYHTIAAYGLQLGFMQLDLNAEMNTLESYLPAVQAAGDRWLLGTLLNELGQVYVTLGNFDRAQEVLQEGLKCSQEMSDVRLIGWALGSLGEAAYYQGNMSSASDLIIEALRQGRDANDKEGVVIRLTQLSAVFCATGHMECAAHLLGTVSLLSNMGNQLLRTVNVERYTKLANLVREKLTPGSFAAAWNAGKTMSLEQTVEYALSYAIFVANPF